MGDDMMDNSREYELPDDAHWLAIVSLIKEKNFLPLISGNDVVWVIINDRCEEIFSLFMLRDIIFKTTAKNSLEGICRDVNTLHFRYYTSTLERGKGLFRSYKGDKYSMYQDGMI
ncbi:MAG: hypothetical protein ACK5LY_04305 [Lachnospirales bacterium]